MDDRATAYANWLVSNQDKKGTPEFETVATAYKQLRADGTKDAPAPSEPEKPKGPEVPMSESAVRGAGQGFLGNFGDEMSGASAASPIPRTWLPGRQPAEKDRPWFDISPERVLTGAALLVTDKLGITGGDATKTYDEAVKKAREADAAASEANPWTYGLSGVGGAIANPLNRAMPAPAASVAGRIAQGAAQGAATGAVYGAGSGEGAADTAGKAASGGLLGAGLGAAATGVIEAATPVIRRIGQIGRGAINPDAAAARTVGNSIADDVANGRGGLAPRDYAAARAQGEDVVLADLGGDRTLAVARSAANSSPEARGAIDEVTRRRFNAQGPNVERTLEDLFGGPIDIGRDAERLRRSAARSNNTAYQRAHTDAENVNLWTPELRRLTAAPDIQDAIRRVERSAQNNAVREGFAPVRNPFRQAADGRLETTPGVTPNLAFWDHVKRGLDDIVSGGERSGTYAAVRDTRALRDTLRAELDRLVPAYRDAREGAARAFGGQDAMEAGARFFRGQTALGMSEAQSALRRMSPADRNLFGRSYAAEMLNDVQKHPDRRDILIKGMFNNPQARLKTELAIGPRRAAQLEARLRLEGIKDRLRTAMGNSTTVRQALEIGLASGIGGSASAAYTGDPRQFFSGAFAAAALRSGMRRVDARVAERVGRLLTADDPEALRRAMNMVASSRQMMTIIRRVEGQISKLAGTEGGMAPAIPMFGARTVHADPSSEDANRRKAVGQ